MSVKTASSVERWVLGSARGLGRRPASRKQAAWLASEGDKADVGADDSETAEMFSYLASLVLWDHPLEVSVPSFGGLYFAGRFHWEC